MLLRDFHLPLFVTDKWVKCYCELILGLASLLKHDVCMLIRIDRTMKIYLPDKSCFFFFWDALYT